LPRPDADIEAKALAYYLEHHVKVPSERPDVIGGLHACIVEWKNSGTQCAMVDLALATMALAVYAQTQDYPTAAQEAASRYQRLLGMAQTQIAEIDLRGMDEKSIDSCLLAIFFMGRYESTMYSAQEADSFRKMHSWSHHDGAMSILKVWDDKLSHKSPSIIVRESRRGLMRSCILRDLDLPEWMEDGGRFGEKGLEAEYDHLNVRLIKLRYATVRLDARVEAWLKTHDRLDQPDGHRMLVESEFLYEEARRLEDALEDWSTRLSHPPTEHTITDPGVLALKHFWSLRLLGYKTSGYGIIWSLYFAQRLFIGSIRLRLLNHTRYGPLKDFTNERERICKEQSQGIADRISASLPSCFEQVRVVNESVMVDSKKVQPLQAVGMVWPLTIAGSASGINTQQQSWFRAELAGAGRTLGAGVIAAAEDWPML
jgi:hypothetical protein